MTPHVLPVAEPLAIIGIGCLFPRAGDFPAFWANVRNRVDAIAEIPATHWRPEDYLDADPKSPDRVYVARGAFLEAVPFPPTEFGIAPNNLEATDTSQLLGLMVAKAALDDAGYDAGRIDRNRVGCILGVTGTLELVIPLGARLGHPIWRRALADAGVPKETADDVVRRIGDNYVGWQENSFPGLLGNVVAGRIANRLDLGGTNCVVDAACASSLSALHLAALELQSGRADLVLTGGVDTFNDIFMYMCFSKTPALSPTGDARPFDRDGDGTILGEGLGMVVLKRLSDARRDNDRIYAVLKGVGSSSDGKGNAVYAPKAAGQIEALRSAYRAAGVTPDTIELVEGHGTGTRVGDATEVEALNEVFAAASGGRQPPVEAQQGADAPRSPWCALGSIKSQIGHTKAAAGAAGLIKAVAALYHKVLPPTIKVSRPLEALESDRAPFYVNTEKRPWLPSATHPRRAAVSAFGFGGSNFHCVLEEADPRKQEIDWDADVQLIALGAATVEELEAALTQWPVDLTWDDLSIRAARSRRDWRAGSAHRLVFVVQRGRGHFGKLLEAARSLLRCGGEAPTARSPDGVFYGHGERTGKLAILFPGQGAQYVGMLRDLACTFPAFFDTLIESDRAFAACGLAEKPAKPQAARISDYLYPMSVFDDPARRAHEESLRDTRIAQPALGAVGLGAWRVLESFGVRGDLFAGHSHGELTAICAAGRIDAADFFALSCLRGRLMAEGRGGAMLAVQSSPDEIRQVLVEERLDLTLANKNAPSQCVLSGSVAEIDRAAAVFSTRQMRATRLAVSAAFHSPSVAAAVRPLRDALEKMSYRTGAPVFANTSAEAYPDDATAARDLLANQLACPVEFVGQIESMYAAGARAFLEVGPGGRLTSLISQILQGKPHDALALDAHSGQRPGSFDLASVLAWLAAQGADVTLSAWGGAAANNPVEKSKPSLVVPICGANYVQPKVGAASRAALPAPLGSRGLPRPIVESPPATHGAATPTMNGHSSERNPPPARAAVLPPADTSALAQALQVTRESLAALQRMQEQAAQLHRQFLEGQDTAQRTVHLLVDQQQRLLQASLGIAPPAPLAVPAPLPLPPLPVQSAVVRAPAPIPVAAPVVPTAPPPPVAQARANPPALSNVAKVEAVLLAVVSEKTGYPAEMLEPGMALDADLGIDSIKRVEILSALQERLPDAPPIKSEHLGTLHTLRDIAEFLAGDATRQQNEPRPSESAGALPDGRGSSSVEAVLLAVVSEKTGYPAEMLEPGMALDADLGIDSIKRVEILSALQERLPDAPPIKSEHLGTLHTLRDIAEFLSNGAAKQSPEPAAPARVPAPHGLERSVLRATPLDPAKPRDRRLLRPGHEIWVTNDDAVLAPLIEQRLAALGFRPRLLSFAAIAEQECPQSLGGLILLAPALTTDDHLRQALRGVRKVASALRRAGKEGGAALLTVSRLDGAFGLASLDPNREPIDGGLAGLAKTAAHEWREVGCKALDLAAEVPPHVAAAAIVEELFLAGPVEVGIGRAGRCTLGIVASPLSDVKGESFQAGDAIVVTGGARGVTAEAALALAHAFRPTLILLGRSPTPGPEAEWLARLTNEADIKRELHLRANGSSSPRLLGEQFRHLMAEREVRHNLARLAAAGAQVVYHAVDVRDTDAVAKLLSEVRREFGPIRGLIHGAGVLADARIEDKTDDEFERVYGTKVVGLRALLAGLNPQELRALVLFSSSTGRFGRTGQVDYAMANEVLNKTAGQHARRLPGCRVVAVNWGPWDGGMVGAELKKLFAKEGVGVIPLTAGAECLVNEIRNGGKEAEVVILGPLVGEAASSAGPSGEAGSSAAPLPLAFERVLDVAEHPVLESHVLDGRPVLPMALMLEWLAHAAVHQNPGLTFHGIDGLRVLHGVILDGPAPTVRVAAGKAVKRDGALVAAVEMRGAGPNGRELVHARAEVVLAADLPPAPPAAPALSLKSYVRSVEEAYESLLFHGPDLQGIERVEGCDAAGIVATVRTAPAPIDWVRRPMRQRWLADPLALDCAFQMMILWSFERHGSGCLPCFTAKYRQYRRAFPADGVRIAARVTRDTGLHVLADLDFLDAEGRVVARMEGYEAVIDPNLRQAFRRNRLVAAVV